LTSQQGGRRLWLPQPGGGENGKTAVGKGWKVLIIFAFYTDTYKVWK